MEKSGERVIYTRREHSTKGGDFAHQRRQAEKHLVCLVKIQFGL